MEIPTSGISYLYTGTIFLLGKYIPHANTIQEIKRKIHMQGKDFKCYPHIIYKITSQIIPSHTMIKKKK